MNAPEGAFILSDWTMNIDVFRFNPTGTPVTSDYASKTGKSDLIANHNAQTQQQILL